MPIPLPMSWRPESSLAQSSGVIESNVGFAVSHEAFKLNEYVTIAASTPRPYDAVGMVCGKFRTSRLPVRTDQGWNRLPISRQLEHRYFIDYNTLHNLDSGDKTFDSFSPSISLQKIIPTSETSFFMFDSMVRWSNMDAETFFPAAGIFADSGNNYRTSLSVSYQNAGL